MPGLRIEVDAWPGHLARWWQDSLETFHSPAWWKQLWERDGIVRVERVDAVPHGADDWLTWTEVCDDWARAQGREPYEQEAEMLRADREPWTSRLHACLVARRA